MVALTLEARILADGGVVVVRRGRRTVVRARHRQGALVAVIAVMAVTCICSLSIRIASPTTTGSPPEVHCTGTVVAAAVVPRRRAERAFVTEAFLV